MEQVAQIGKRDESPPEFAVTERAAEAVRAFLAEKGSVGPEAGLRVGVRGGGCSGLSFFLDIADAGPDPATDHVITAHGVRVFIDKKSALFLNESQLDYVTGLKENGFKISNPKLGKACGCGESFTF